MITFNRHDTFHFRHRDDWQEATEQQEQREEQAETADQHAQVDPRWMEVRPT